MNRQIISGNIRMLLSRNRGNRRYFVDAAIETRASKDLVSEYVLYLGAYALTDLLSASFDCVLYG